MKTLINLFSSALIALVFVACSQNSPVQPIETQAISESNVPAQYIVEMQPGAVIQSGGSFNCGEVAKSILVSHDISAQSVVAVYSKVLRGFCANITPSQAGELRKDPRVKQIEKDQPAVNYGFLVPTNPKDHNILAQTTPWGINAVGGSVDATSNTGVAWIVDTGIDLSHPDLNVNTTLSRTFVRTGADATTADDLNGHGTHVAGTIAAKNNSVGVVGVCAGATVIAVKVLNRYGSGYVSDIISGLDYVSDNLVDGKLNVVNMSLGGSASNTLDAAVTNLADAGAYIVIAAGNSRANSNNYSPARDNGDRIFTISAYDNSGRFASWSNWGNGPIDYSAPGARIYSSYKDGRYATMSGTSMAAPHVAGILLANDGTINYSGTDTYDPDGTPDRKAIR